MISLFKKIKVCLFFNNKTLYIFNALPSLFSLHLCHYHLKIDLTVYVER